MKFATEQEFVRAIFAYFGLNEALRSDQSYEAFLAQLEAALRAWVQRPTEYIRVAFTFADRVVAYVYREDEGRAVWEIPYTRDEADNFTFGTPVVVKEVALFEPVAESKKASKGQAFTETIEQVMRLTEASSSGAPGGRAIRAVGITADVVNANRRRYPRAVLAAAVAGLNSHLHESNGQGRLIATGEVEHPIDKGGRPNLLETVVKWSAASLDSAGKVLLEGVIIPTGKGKDISTLIEHGVPVGVSMRGYGSFQPVQESGETIHEVTELTIKGFDLVAQPSDPNGQVVESQQPKPERRNPMNLEELLKLLKEQPDTLKAVMESLGLAQRNELAEALQVPPAQLKRAIEEAAAAKKELDERKRAEAIDAAIVEACGDLPYDDETNRRFVEAIRALKPEKAEAIEGLVETKRGEWDALLAAQTLAAMGRQAKSKGGKTVIEMVGPVFERETGQPEFTRGAYMLNESMIRTGHGKRRKLATAETPAEIFTRQYLDRYDQNFRHELIAESRRFEEAEQTSDLNLPYTVMRTVIEQAFPELIAANVFDFGVMQNSPERLYFETHVGETGAVVTIVDEVVTGAHGAWVALAQKRLRPGTVVLTHSTGTPTYVEGTDYVIDYGEGQIMTLATGATTNAQSLKIDYIYDAIRKGEMATIERAKNALSFIVVNAAADRLAVQVSNEAITFSRSQLGYDAVGRTLANLMRDIRRRIDANILYSGLAASLQQPNNSGGTWTSASDPIAQFVEKLGYAKVKIYNRFYAPTAIVLSQTNADRLSNWDGFKTDGFPNAVLNAAGFAGSIKGLPIFASPEFSDAFGLVCNRELVMHRVYQAMMLKGPFPSFSSDKLIGADQYYVEEFNNTAVPVIEKAAHVRIA